MFIMLAAVQLERLCVFLAPLKSGTGALRVAVNTGGVGLEILSAPVIFGKGGWHSWIGQNSRCDRRWD
jgi:hypothetical protein